MSTSPAETPRVIIAFDDFFNEMLCGRCFHHAKALRRRGTALKKNHSSEIFLQNFQKVLPPYKFPQSELNQWLQECHLRAADFQGPTNEKQIDPENFESFFKRYGIKEGQISQRSFECPDFLNKNSSESKIYSITSDHSVGFDIQERTRFFSEKALNIFSEIYPLENKPSLPDHLLHVTCTGYISPSAPQKFVGNDLWKKHTGITHLYHMGCYASLPAVRLGQALVTTEATKEPDYFVDIVHTEMCGLHMNPLFNTPEQIIVQTLFADGHIKYTVAADKTKEDFAFKIKAVHEQVVPHSEEDMSWMPSPWGMQMTLSRDVPNKIRQELRPFLINLLRKADISLAETKEALFAVHPGGPKIIDFVQTELELEDAQVALSKKVLFERGNMSSATLPHVWNEILKSKPSTGQLVISFAFGPGLTLFGAVFEIS